MEDYAPHTYFLERLLNKIAPFFGKVWVYIELTITVLYVALCMYVMYLFYMAPR